MQSAAGSLRGAGPSLSVKLGDTHVWGVGTDSLSLAGHYRFRVVKGAVTICGVALSLCASPSGTVTPSDWIEISAPTAPYPAIAPTHSQHQTNLYIPEQLSDFVSAIEVEESSLPLDLGKLAPPFKALWPSLCRVEDPNSLVRIPKSWVHLVDFTSVSSRSNTQFLVLGPKNSGKSWLARYLCNRLLNSKGRKLYFLELDPGHPEYTPPGCISLHTVTDYNFSPAYAHADFRCVVKSHHLGYTNPMETPQRYLNMCMDLFKTFSTVASKNDYLVVNTPGWTKGLGLDICTDLSRIFDTNVMVPLHLGPSDFESQMVEVECIETNRDAGNSTLTSSGFSSTELISLQTISYLHHKISDHLTTWAPFELEIGAEGSGLFAIAILDSAGVNLADDSLVCIEGTLVAINVLLQPGGLKPGILDDSSSNSVWEQSKCVGMGIIQSVAEDLSSLRLLTPLDPSTCGLAEQKIVLVRGRLQLPVWALFNRDFPNSPWISLTKAVGTGATYTKFRRNIRRN